MILSPNTLLMWAYGVGFFDLLSAVLFSMVSFKTICNRLSWLTIFAVVFGLFWVSMILMLLVGIHGRNPKCVRAWIIFSCLGILVEMFLILYAVFTESSFQIGLVKNGLLLMLGLCIECSFLYIVYRFYVTLAFCQACHKTIQSKVVQQHLTEPSQDSNHQRQKQARDQHNNRFQIQNPKGKIVQNTPSHPRKLSFLQTSNSNLSP
ncbi:uncharacterized protein LOC108051401 [Drosophila rhopaloa]|uniref:Uncharacterized protein LOC108051401 n=1 Tax=Drosophila rhopaloa TaxID=1041015 RepID=A0A6P4FI60_DRORH|nr:uncharacterized protein LOC108051401 [Drosophila rhopaloa]